MKSAAILKFVNPALFIVFIVNFIVILMQKINYAEWMYTAHVWIGYSTGLLLLIHIYFNWGWVKNNFFKKKKSL